MTDFEYKKQVEEITKQFGQPEYDGMNGPVNESAKRLIQLRHAFTKSKREAKKVREVMDGLKEVNTLASDIVEISEDLIDPVWLVSFTDKQKEIIYSWCKNTKASNKAIAEDVGCTTKEVRTLKSLSAFGLLVKHLCKGYKESLPLEAWVTVGKLLRCTTDSVRKDIALLILKENGDLKGNLEENRVNIVLDPEMEKKYKELGDRLLDDKKE